MAESVSTYEGEGVNQAGTPEQIYNAIASAEEPIQVSDGGFSEDPPVAQDQDRPEWLPEKFGSPEELAQAYKSLEQQFHASSEERAQQEEQERFETEEAPEILDTSSSQVHKMLDERGLDFSVFQDEYNETGELSTDAYKALEEAGVSKQVVDTWIDGQEARAEQMMNDIYNITGGEANYNLMLQWADNNLEPYEAEAFNKQISNLDEASQFAVNGLYARYQQSEGAIPSLMSGDINVSTQPRYESLAQLTSDMSDPRYAEDPAFRSKVAARLQNSNVL